VSREGGREGEREGGREGAAHGGSRVFWREVNDGGM
jgi:hypothetical protein